MPKVSFATLIGEGLVGPKLRPYGVGDGQAVQDSATRFKPLLAKG